MICISKCTVLLQPSKRIASSSSSMGLPRRFHHGSSLSSRRLGRSSLPTEKASCQASCRPQTSTDLGGLTLLLPLAASFPLASPQTSHAEDATSPQLAAGALVNQAGVASQSASDQFVSIAFTIIIGLLTIVTLGVAYLSLLSWIDSREENKARTEATQGIKGLPSEKQVPKREDKEEEEMLLSLRRGESKRDKSRGFAATRGRHSPPREF